MIIAGSNLINNLSQCSQEEISGFISLQIQSMCWLKLKLGESLVGSNH
jgi:hypothetical protein